MIPKAAIVEWRKAAPWSADALVEQDLVLSRALVALYADPQIGERLAFRGGTALHKLHLRPAARYSEDIDLVQVRAEPIGDTLDLIRSALDPWLGTPRRKHSEGRVTLIYRFASEDASPVTMRLKIEINTREHFSELGIVRMPFVVESGWFRGRAELASFCVDELLGTKLRALYQRRKGRDLFDLWLALDRGLVNPDQLVRCFERYMAHGDRTVTRAQFEANLDGKAQRRDFRDDMRPLVRPGLTWEFERALRVVSDELVARLPGAPWKGPAQP